MSLSGASWTHFAPSHLISFNSISIWLSHLHLVLPVGPLTFAPQNLLCISLLIHACHTPCQYHSLLFDNPMIYSSPIIVQVIKSRRMRWAGHVARMGEERGVYRVLVGKPEGKRPMGRPRCRWVDNIRMDLQEVGCGYMDWIGLAQDRDRWRKLVSAVMNVRVPWNAGNFLTSCKTVSCSRRTLHHGVSMIWLSPSATTTWRQPVGYTGAQLVSKICIFFPSTMLHVQFIVVVLI